MDKIINEIDEIMNIKNDYFYISKKLVEIYYDIGKYLYNNKNKSYKIIYDTEQLLRNKYGLLVGFSRRNLNNMLKFYETYSSYDIKKLREINWNNHLIIMKQNNKDELINYCLKYNIDKENLKKIIKSGFNLKYLSDSKKQNDSMTLEIISLKCGKL